MPGQPRKVPLRRSAARPVPSWPGRALRVNAPHGDGTAWFPDCRFYAAEPPATGGQGQSTSSIRDLRVFGSGAANASLPAPDTTANGWHREQPGPTNCTSCRKFLRERPRTMSESSVQCNHCRGWIHLTCAGLSHPREYNRSFTGPCCQRRDQQSTAPIEGLKVLQLNTNGLKNKLNEVLRFMDINSCKIAAIQETFLSSKSKDIKAPGYTVVRQDRARGKGGGLAFIVHDSVQFRLLDTASDSLEHQMIAIRSGDSEIYLSNVYIPPS